MGSENIINTKNSNDRVQIDINI